MIPALIVVVSLLTMLQFFLAHCRSLLIGFSRTRLSEAVREAAGVHGEFVAGDEFRRLLMFLQLCPAMNGDQFDLLSVRAYYRLLKVFSVVSRLHLPVLGKWAARERAACSHFAAVALDRRISHHRRLVTQYRDNP